MKIREPQAGEPVNRGTFVCMFDCAAWQAARQRDGGYILRACLPWDDPPSSNGPAARGGSSGDSAANGVPVASGESVKSGPVDWATYTPRLWAWYVQLVQAEEAFKTLKGDLHLRPIHHHLGQRVEAHIFVAFLGYESVRRLKHTQFEKYSIFLLLLRIELCSNLFTY